MSATDEEIVWAKTIKDAAAKDDSLKPISDFEYLQHAIVAKDKVKKALARIKRMQKFREHYGIPSQGEPHEEACKHLRGYIEQLVDLTAGVGIDSKGRYVVVMEYSKFDPGVLKGDKEWGTMMKGMYYSFVAIQHRIESLREGVVFLADCKDIGWQNFSLEAEKRAAEFYSDSFPMRMKEMVMLNAPGILRVMYVMCKVFISKKIRETIVMTANDDYIEQNKDVYPEDLLPPCLGGTCTQAMVAERLEASLKTRLENELNFKL